MIFYCLLVFQGTKDYKQVVDNDVMQWMKRIRVSHFAEMAAMMTMENFFGSNTN